MFIQRIIDRVFAPPSETKIGKTLDNIINKVTKVLPQKTLIVAKGQLHARP